MLGILSENPREKKNKILIKILRSVKAVDGKQRQAAFEKTIRKQRDTSVAEHKSGNAGKLGKGKTNGTSCPPMDRV